jgi:exodeoxyribonuclease-3
MKIATWNINNLKRRLPLLLEWLAEAKPDAVALQETKVTDADFPRAALEAAGYGSLGAGQRTWNGVALLARGAEPVAVRRELPGDPADGQARYLEAAIGGVLVASLYLPNGNPQPGPKFAYKMAWFERLIAHAAELQASGPSGRSRRRLQRGADRGRRPIHTTSYRDNALLQPAPRAAYRTLLEQGWTDAIRKVHPTGPVYTFGTTCASAGRAMRACGSTPAAEPGLAPKLADAGVDREVRGRPDASDHAAGLDPAARTLTRPERFVPAVEALPAAASEKPGARISARRSRHLRGPA